MMPEQVSRPYDRVPFAHHDTVVGHSRNRFTFCLGH